jgi:protein-tyrosine-phosphatase
MTDPAPFHTLFLCTGNSARSILAEAILNREGQGRFIAHSAGSRPTGAPNPFAIALLQREGFDTSFARSKSWDEFALPGAPKLDFVFTVCDSAAAEECPYWPGQPVTAHWGLPDPAAVDGNDAEKALAFAQTFRALTRRIQAFAALPIASLDALTLKARLTEIGKTP